ncbi:MAG: alpha/beta fold hydrolase [Vicinamibacteria bacterium]
MTSDIAIENRKSTNGRSIDEMVPRITRGMTMMGAVIRGVDRVSPALGARVAARIFLSPRRARLPERERAWLGSATPEVFVADRFRLSGHRWSSSGEPVLLVHGWEGRGSQLGGLALAIAAQGYQPITVDLPAHGASKGAQTNLIEFSRAVTAMVAHLGGVAGIVAHSFGAAGTTIALQAALPVGRVVYLAPSEDFDHFPRFFGKMLGLPRPLTGRMQLAIETGLGKTMSELRGSKLASGMTAPLLIVHDEDDTDVPWRDGKTYSEVWPGATLMTTRGYGHRRILREPDVLKAVAEFFKTAEPKGATK